MIKKMRIETNRLIIRPYIANDLLESFQLMQNKELFKYLDMDVMSFEEYEGLFKWLIVIKLALRMTLNILLQSF